MRTIQHKTRAAAVAAALSMTLFTAACGGSDSSDSSSSQGSGSSDSSSSQSEGDSQSSPQKASGASADLVGPGCASYAKKVPDGAGSVDGMAKDPVATAASNNPLLKTLTATVTGKFNKKVDLVDTLNGGEFTVFAPVDDAFAKIDKKTLNQLSKPANAKMLESILTYHVVPGQLGPDEVAGKHKTANGAKLKVEGSGDDITVGKDDAKVICGGVKTANATVYLIDSVLMPPK